MNHRAKSSRHPTGLKSLYDNAIFLPDIMSKRLRAKLFYDSSYLKSRRLTTTTTLPMERPLVVQHRFLRACWSIALFTDAHSIATWGQPSLGTKLSATEFSSHLAADKKHTGSPTTNNSRIPWIFSEGYCESGPKGSLLLSFRAVITCVPWPWRISCSSRLFNQRRFRCDKPFSVNVAQQLTTPQKVVDIGTGTGKSITLE